MLAEWALTSLGLERLELLAHPENEASLRLAERAGFTREGTAAPLPPPPRRARGPRDVLAAGRGPVTGPARVSGVGCAHGAARQPDHTRRPRPRSRAGRSTRRSGWTTRAAPEDDVVFFQAGGMVRRAVGPRAARGGQRRGGLGRLGRRDARPQRALARRGGAVIEEARAAGADIVREPAETLLGRLLGRVHRPGRPSLGGGAQPALDDPRKTARSSCRSRRLAIARVRSGIRSSPRSSAAIACSCVPPRPREAEAADGAWWRLLAVEWWTRAEGESDRQRQTRRTTSTACVACNNGGPGLRGRRKVEGAERPGVATGGPPCVRDRL